MQKGSCHLTSLSSLGSLPLPVLCTLLTDPRYSAILRRQTLDVRIEWKHLTVHATQRPTKKRRIEILPIPPGQ
jgi:hypothetical protein